MMGSMASQTNKDDPTPPEDGQVRMTFAQNDLALQLFGQHNANLNTVARAVGVEINVRGNSAFIRGDKIQTRLAENVLRQLYGLIKEKYPVYPKDVEFAVKTLSKNDQCKLREIFLDKVYITAKKRVHHPEKPGPETIHRRHPRQ